MILVSEGPQLSKNAKRNYEEEEDADDAEIVTTNAALAQNFERMDELIGKPVLEMKTLKRLRQIFSIPTNAFTENSRRYVCLIHGKSGLDVCHPPHVVVSASRNFAIYSENYFIVPKTQLGIVSPSGDKNFLKALALFLSSEFTFYHQFFRSTQMGLKRPVATLKALRQLPVPIMALKKGELEQWSNLHEKLAKCPPRKLNPKYSEAEQKGLFAEENEEIEQLLQQLNDLTAQALGLDERERVLIHDFVRVRFSLDDGQQGYEAVRLPTDHELHTYARRLKEELDSFIAQDADRLHRVSVVRG